MGSTLKIDEHPEELVRIDRRYLIAWGRKEVLRAAAGGAAGVTALSLLSWAQSSYWALGMAPVLAATAFLILFFRNPARQAPPGPGLIVSPADGTVQDITRVVEEEFVGGPCVRIGIFLSVFDVHVNRAPVSGQVAWVRYRRGAFHDARSEAASRENEANTIAIIRSEQGGPPEVRLLVKQISGAIARRIICPLAPGAGVARGGLIGMIKYGSRTEIYIPEDAGAEIRVAVGCKVKGGRSVVAAWQEGAGAPPPGREG